MKEPLRLLSDTDTPAGMRQVLSAAGAAPPLPPAIRSAMLDVAGRLAVTSVAASAAVGTQTTVVVLQATAAKIASKALLVMACLGGAGGLAYVAEPLVVGAFQHQRPMSSAAINHRLQTPQPPAAEERRPAAAAEPAPTSEPPLAKAPMVVAPRSSATGERDSESFPEEQSTIASEARLLERARGHLASDPAYALEETNVHLDRFGKGQMSSERELIAVEALLRLGRRAEAERRAAPRLQLDPGGLYTKRLRQLLEEF